VLFAATVGVRLAGEEELQILFCWTSPVNLRMELLVIRTIIWLCPGESQQGKLTWPYKQNCIFGVWLQNWSSIRKLEKFCELRMEPIVIQPISQLSETRKLMCSKKQTWIFGLWKSCKIDCPLARLLAGTASQTAELNPDIRCPVINCNLQEILTLSPDGGRQ
jgi:hypothetical protein